MTMMNPEMPSAKQTATASSGGSVSGGAIFEPRELDILVGKETRARNHKGSRCFRLFVESYRRRYQDAKNKHKRASITREMYETITQASIRFLKYNEQRQGWEEISSTEARDKITHALRFAQKKRRKHCSKTTPARQNSDSTHRSETSTTSATSLDWDALILQQQQHLTGLSLSSMNASLRACRTAHRSSLSSVGSASHLSRGEDSLSKDSSSRRGGSNHGSRNNYNTANSNNNSNSNHNSSTNNNKARVSFSVTESAIYSADLSTSVTTTSFASIDDSTVPLPVDLSSTQHFDMHTSQASLGGDVEIVDRPPRMPSRPTEAEDEYVNNNINSNDDDDDDENEDDWDDDDVLKRAGIDTLMNSSASGFCDLLDPLMEMDHERGPDSSSDTSSSSHKEALLEDYADDDERKIPAMIESTNSNSNMAQLDTEMANLCLQQHLPAVDQSATRNDTGIPSMAPTTTSLALQAAHYDNNEATTIDAAASPPLCFGAGDYDPFMPMTATHGTSGKAPMPDQPTSEYSLQLMQEPLLEWWKES